MSDERGWWYAEVGGERSTTAQPIGAGKTAAGLHQPTSAPYEQQAYGPPEDREHNKHAVRIANQNYASVGPLHEPVDEASLHRGRPPSPPEVVPSSRVSLDEASIRNGRPPSPPEPFSSGQVSGVVSSATGKGPHIRFVVDTCCSGATVPAVREVREPELAAAGSVSDQLRVAALTGLRELKDSLLAHCRQRETTSRELSGATQQRRARAPAAGSAPATRRLDVAGFDAASARVPDAFDRVAAQMWDECIPLLNIVRMAVGHRPAPPRITDYRRLGAQLSYIDGLRNTVAQRMGCAGSDGQLEPKP